MALRHLRAADYVRMRWRNGAGETRQIARYPATGDNFMWRLSLATVAASGPFSAYSGFSRSVSLVAGAGFDLTVDHAQPVRLAAPGDTLLFAGAAATHCSLLDGPCTDLSLMVHEPGAIHRVRLIRPLQEPLQSLDAGTLNALFCLRGAVQVQVDQTPSCTLAEGDTWLYETPLPESRSVRLSGAGEATSPQVLLLSWVF